MLRALAPVLRFGRLAAGLLLGLLLLLVVVRPVRAEEAVVLDNGTVLRGSVIREDVTTIQLRLSGVGRDNRVTVEKDRIVQRFATTVAATPGTPSTPTDVRKPVVADPAESASHGPVPLVAGLPRVADTPDLPDEEPSARQESVFERIGRRALLAFPSAPLARAFIAALGVVLLLCLVGLGAKMADIKGLTLANGTVLALLLGVLLTVTALWSDPLLRADLAAVWLPIALLSWTGSAAAILKCRLGRAFVLLAFVLFSGLLTTFSAGVVLLTV